jgi:hypothetical protein
MGNVKKGIFPVQKLYKCKQICLFFWEQISLFSMNGTWQKAAAWQNWLMSMCNCLQSNESYGGENIR